MPTFIITGSYTTQGMKGLIANPSDRGAANKAFTAAAGGKLKDFYITSGDKDFMLIVEADDSADLAAAVMVAGASGTVSGLKTIRAYTNDEFNAMQKKAGTLAGKFQPAG